MVKGVSIKFKSFPETTPKLLSLIKLDKELKKHDRIVLKPFCRDSTSPSSNMQFVEQILRYCLEHKNPTAEISIAEGSDGEDTMDVFDSKGFRKLAETYSVGLIDLNYTETEEIHDSEFTKFEKVLYPKILLESFIISLPTLAEDPELEMIGSMSNMIGSFPAKHYQSFFSQQKNKIRRWPIKYSIHDILKCKMPELALIDASEKGYLLAGSPKEVDKQATKLIGKDYKSISHLRLIDERFGTKNPEDNKETQEDNIPKPQDKNN